MDGILNVYKEKDYTSFDVVAVLRGILHERKIGHTGTLDPMAEGVLPICVGSATGLCEMLSSHDKVYETVMILGETYDTLDVTGNRLTKVEVMSTIAEADITNAVMEFVGGYNQVPPMYSAKKINGQKLYDLARQGIVVERKPVEVDIYDIEITDISIPRVTMRVHCGPGTYIRSLIDDIGKKLGCGAAMETLKRTRVREFEVSDALKLSEIEKCMKDGTIDKILVPIEKVFECNKKVFVPTKLCKLLKNGNKFTGEDFDEIRLVNPAENNSEVSIESLEDGEQLSFYDDENTFTAVYTYNRTKDEMKPYKMFLKRC